MATTDNELKKLNQTVTEAVSILKLYVGTTGQLKNLNEKQREIIASWGDVVLEEKEQQKQTRAFTERERDANGRFIKKREESTKSFLNMAKSVGGMFKKVGRGISSSVGFLTSGIKDNLSRFYQAVKSHFLSLFGEESEWFDILGSIKDSVMNVGRSIYTFIFKRTPSWAKKQIGVLKDLYKLQLKQMKMDWLSATGKKKKEGGWGAALTMVLVGIAAGIAAWLHRKLIVLTKIFPIFKKLSKVFKALEATPIIGKLIKGLKFGWKWFGWPLTLLLSIIDFIKGYSRTEGTMWDKIKGGLWAALEGFIELPVRFISWVVEKVAGLFGVELDGMGNKIMDMIHIGFNVILDFIKDFNPFTPIISFFKGFFGKDGTLMQKISAGASAVIIDMSSIYKKWGDKIMSAISPIITGVYNFFVDFWNSAVSWMTSKIPEWLPGKDSIVKGLQSTTLSRMEPPETSVTSALNQNDKMKIENKQKSDKEIKDAMDNMTKTIKEENRKTGDAINAISQVQGGSNNTTGIEASQIPDETDNNLIGLMNFNM